MNDARNPNKKKAGKSSGYIGVCKKNGSWTASIQKDGVRQRLGSFTTELEAAKAYNTKALELHGKKAKINIILQKHENGDVEKIVRKQPTSKYRGVCLSKGKWKSTIIFERVTYFLGYFDSEIEAAEAYNKKALELNPNFRNLNDIR